MTAETPAPPTPQNSLPDHLREDLRLVFIGINPGLYSAQVGHYYARPGNLFWWALSNSGLLRQPAGPERDAALMEEGIGFTDVVKRPTHSSGDLRQHEFDEGARHLAAKIEQVRPRVACFVGLLGATAFFGRHVRPGPLTEKIGSTAFFAMPSPSRRNAHYGRDKILSFFKDLNEFVERVVNPGQTLPVRPAVLPVRPSRLPVRQAGLPYRPY